jgi:hypothetical protein
MTIEEVWTKIDESCIHSISNLGRVRVDETRRNANGRHQIQGTYVRLHAPLEDGRY